MSKAEKFIEDYTRNCSNEIQSPYPQIVENICKIDGEPAKEFSPWLTPDQARKAVEIAREEVIEKMEQFLKENYLVKSTEPLRWIPLEKVFNDFRKAMKNE